MIEYLYLMVDNVIGGVKCMINVNLLNLRKKFHFTQEEVAEKIGVSRQAVAKWENGETVPDIYNCKALANLYNVSLDDLISHEDKANGKLIPPKGKYIFGVVTIGERGQIVIPKKARDVFELKSGDTLLMLGDEEQGIAMMPTTQYMSFIENVMKSFEEKSEE